MYETQPVTRHALGAKSIHGGQLTAGEPDTQDGDAKIARRDSESARMTVVLTRTLTEAAACAIAAGRFRQDT